MGLEDLSSEPGTITVSTLIYTVIHVVLVDYMKT